MRYVVRLSTLQVTADVYLSETAVAKMCKWPLLSVILSYRELISLAPIVVVAAINSYKSMWRRDTTQVITDLENATILLELGYTAMYRFVWNGVGPTYQAYQQHLPPSSFIKYQVTCMSRFPEVIARDVVCSVRCVSDANSA